ncbi:hypothetical protein GB937_010662 [Aspergillus fischeri]|nr:hypothetical protein GB937_010662 [Aspergillus fischeri]
MGASPGPIGPRGHGIGSLCANKGLFVPADRAASVVREVGIVWLLGGNADRALGFLPIPSVRAFSGGVPARAVGAGGALLEAKVPVIVGAGVVPTIQREAELECPVRRPVAIEIH